MEGRASISQAVMLGAERDHILAALPHAYAAAQVVYLGRPAADDAAELDQALLWRHVTPAK